MEYFLHMHSSISVLKHAELLNICGVVKVCSHARLDSQILKVSWTASDKQGAEIEAAQ